MIKSVRKTNKSHHRDSENDVTLSQRTGGDLNSLLAESFLPPNKRQKVTTRDQREIAPSTLK